MKFEVVAPSDLECGYPLEVEINGKPLVIPVPYNAKAGDIIQIDLDDTQVSETPVAEATAQETYLPPSKTAEENTIAWRDDPPPHGPWTTGLCGCCDICCISGLWCNALFFPCVVWGQLLTRLRLGPCANPDRSGHGSATFYIVAGLVTSCVLTLIILAIVGGLKSETKCHTETYDTGYVYGYGSTSYSYEDCSDEAPLGIAIAWIVIYFFLFLYMIVMLTRLRRQFRRQYQIPGSCCYESCCDDLCCMYWCGCCNIIQMARHPYDESKYECFSTTGLTLDAPQIV